VDGLFHDLPPDGDEELRGALDAPPLLRLPAQGGRSLEFIRAVCGVAVRFELPNPCGARPESVVLPCAFQLRPVAGGLDELLLLSELFGREPFALLLNEPLGRELLALLLNEPLGRELLALLLNEPLGRELLALLLNEPLGREFCGCAADGGRLDDGCDGRALLKLCALFPPRPKFPAGLLPPWFADRDAEFIVRTGMCEAAAAGVERATTLRFCTPAEGVATRPRTFDAPKKLECVGEAFTPPVTRALRNELAERCVALRLIAWPFTKVLCDATVTAFTLRAYR
jgi:hypothetical protein